MNDREIKEFEAALEQIVAKARDFGLDFFEMRYEICPAEVLYSFGAYGMPTRFTHWSFGKAYYRMKTQYDYNLSRIYELVINSDPCYAFLLEGNTVLQNKVIAAHVLAHSDFFKHNARFSHTSRDMVETMANNARRIASYEFAHGSRRVEEVLDAALALQYHVDPYLVRHPRPRPFKKQPGHSPESPKPAAPPDPYEDLWSLDAREGQHPADPGSPRERAGSSAPGAGGKTSFAQARDPDEPPTSDLLLFLLQRSRNLEEWERDILAIVREEMLYFYPQLETKVMNEGWASFWHARIMREIDLTDAEAVEFAKMHAHVLQPNPMGINPYRVGYEIFLDIEKRYGTEAIFEVRECEQDASFLRNYLTKELVSSLDLYLYRKVNGEWVIVDKDWEAVRDRLVAETSHGGIPRIVVEDDDYRGNGELVIRHCYEGEELDQHYVDKTMPYLYRLWGRPVHLRTVFDGRPLLVSYDGRIHRRQQD